MGLVAVALALGACGSSTTSSSGVAAPQQLWGDEAVAFFEAHALTICSQDIYDVVSFYDPEVIADYRSLTRGQFPGQLRQGRHEMAGFLDLCLFSPTSEIDVDVVDVFLHPEGAVTVERWTDGDGGEGTMVAALVDLGPGGIELIRYLLPVEQLAGPGDEVGDDDPLDEPVRLLIEQRWPDQPWSSIDIYGFRVDDGDLDEVLVFTSDGDSCPVRTASWWVLEDRAVVEERQHVGVTSRACLDAGELPEGWWSGRSLPTPLDERRTADLVIGGQVIKLYNSTPEREALVVWSFERFGALGLAAPEIDEIIFEPSRSCAEFTGLTRQGAAGNTVYHCVHDITCDSSSCDRFTDLAKLSMLHELAHPWLDVNIDPRRRQTFLELTTTVSWNDESTDWDEQGVEWAAEVLAWGLLDGPMELLRLGFPPCDLRIDAFQLLTTEEPLTLCEAAP